MNSAIVRRITEAIHDGNAVFMLGAGISMFRRSACPGWQAMVTEIMSSVAKDTITDPVKYITPHFGVVT